MLALPSPNLRSGTVVLVPTDPDPDELLVGPRLGPVTHTATTDWEIWHGNLGGAQCMLALRTLWPSLTSA